jgi:hypothetical protein
MTPDADPASLRHEELVALVWQLRQQLAERDQEIERLRSQLVMREAPAVPQEAPPAVPTDPDPGSKEDLLAQLEKIYAGGS